MKKIFNKKIRRPIVLVVETTVLTSIILLSVFPLSCRVSMSGLEIIGSDCRFPVLENYEVLDSRHLLLQFSEPVSLIAGGISSQEENPENIGVNCEPENDGKNLVINMNSKTQIGKDYVFTGQVQNKGGSSLTFSYKFKGYNDCIPKLLMTEIMDEVRSFTSKKVNYKIYEFVEFLALTDGNLSGLKLSSVNDGEEKDFYFPDTEVKAGDYITVHFRKSLPDSEACINETTGDKTFSKGLGSSTKAWDFWIDNTTACLGASQDIIRLENTNNGEIQQALVYSRSDKETWSKESFKNAVTEIFSENIWEGTGEIRDAVVFPKSANLVRINVADLVRDFENGLLSWPVPSNKNEWTSISNKNLTPGEENLIP